MKDSQKSFLGTARYYTPSYPKNLNLFSQGAEYSVLRTLFLYTEPFLHLASTIIFLGGLIYAPKSRFIRLGAEVKIPKKLADKFYDTG